MTNISPTIHATTASGQRVSLLNLQRASPAQAQALRQAQLRPDYLGPARQRQAARAGSANAARTLAAMGRNVTTSLAGAGKAITGPGYLQNKTQTKQQQQYYDDYDKFLAQQNYVTRPTYKKASELADKWEKGIPSAESIERGVSAGVPSNLQGAASTFARFGRGVVLAPADLVRTVGLGAAASEYALRNPSKVTAGAVAGGLGIMARDMEAAAKENPGEFAGRVTGGVLLSKGLGKVGGPLKRAAYRVNPYYEDVAVYKGKPSIVEGLKGEQPFLTRQPTKTGTVGKVLDPELTQKPREYYHGTSGEFVKEIQSQGKFKVASNNPSALSEFKANRARVNTGSGKTVSTSRATESALFLGAPDTAYGTFSSGGLIRIKGTVIPMSKTTAALARKREALRSAGKRVPKALNRDLNVAAFKDYFNAGKGDIIPSPKPLSGYEWVRRGALSDKVVGSYPEWEYVIQPGTKLYPKQSLRSKAYNKIGIRKGNKFTIDPETGETIEILDVTTKAAESEVLGAPLVDIEGAVSKARTSVASAKDAVKKKVSSTAGGIKKTVSRRARTSSSSSRKKNPAKAKIKAKAKAKAKDESPQAQRERKIRRKQRADSARATIKGGRRAVAGSVSSSRRQEQPPTVDDVFEMAFGVRLNSSKSTPKPKPTTSSPRSPASSRPKPKPTQSSSRSTAPRTASTTRPRSRKPTSRSSTQSRGSPSRTDPSPRSRATQRRQKIDGDDPARRPSERDPGRISRSNTSRPPRRDERSSGGDDPRDTPREARRDDRRNLRPSAPRVRAPPRSRSPKRVRRAAPLDPLSTPGPRPTRPRSGDTDDLSSRPGEVRKKKQHREKAPYASVADLMRFISG